MAGQDNFRTNFAIAASLGSDHVSHVTITLPDDPALRDFTEAEIRLDLACALFARGRISREIAARMAGLDRRRMDEELFRRKISSLSDETLEQDLRTLDTLFPG